MDNQVLNQTALLNCLRVAKEAGVPRDQANQFISHGHIPLPWQWDFHAVARQADNPDGPVDIGLGGARGPGKSHAVLAQAGLDDCQRVPGLKGLFLRQTGIAAQESFDDLVMKVIQGRAAFKKTGAMLSFPNGSRILLGGFRDEKDIDKYIGIEYDFIIVEELNQLTEEKYTKLRGSLRTSKPNWRPRMYVSFNPGGIGHTFVKERYVIPHMKDEQKDTFFVPSTYKENPYLNKEYINYLESLTGELGRAWREGDWDIFAGQMFPEFRQKTHVIPSVKPSVSFEHGLSIDWGYTDKKACAFSAYLHALIKMKLPDGQNFNRIITYKEWSGNLKRPREWAKIIFEDCLKMGIKPTKGIADSSMFNPSSDYGKSIADLFMDEWKTLNSGNSWLLLGKGTKDRIGRVATAHDWLSIAPDGLPYWLMTKNCFQLITTLPVLQVDEHNFEDVDTTGLDDPYDSTTYYLYGGVKFIGIKAGALNYGQGAPLAKVQFDNKGNQVPLDSSEWAKMYPKET